MQNSKLSREARKIKSQILLIVCMVFIFLGFSFAQDEPGYDSGGRRNPFIPLVTNDGRLLNLEPQPDTVGLSLEGIIYDKHGVSYAVVNQEVVKTGEYAGEYQVLKIEARKVTFIKDGQTLETELKDEKEGS